MVVALRLRAGSSAKQNATHTFNLARLILIMIMVFSRCYAADDKLIPPFFTHLHNKQLEAIGHQWATIQDSSGFMWFGGRQGLVRYDAYTFKPYLYDNNNSRSLSANFVVALANDSHGHLWVGTRHGLNRYDAETDDFTRFMYNPNDPNGVGALIIGFNGLLPDKKGALWVGTSGGGLSKFDEKSASFSNIPIHVAAKNGSGRFIQVEMDEVRALYKDSLGTLWMGCGSSREKISGICALQASSAQVQYYPYHTKRPGQGVGYQSAMNFYEDHAGQLWLATLGGGLYRIDPGAREFTRYYHQPDNPNSIGNDEVWSVIGDSNQNLWVATDKGGLNHLTGKNRFERYRHIPEFSSSIATNKVTSIYENRFGDFWLGYYPSGASLLNPYANAFHQYRHNLNSNSLSDGGVRAVAETQSGNLWIGTEHGLNFLDRSTGRITRFTHSPKDPDNPTHLPVAAVSALLVDSHNSLWIGLYRGGLCRYSASADSPHGHFTRYSFDTEDRSSLSSNVVFRLYEDRDKTIWVGTENGLNRYQPATNNFIRYLSHDVDLGLMSHEWVYSMLQDSRGNFWLGLDSGLARMDLKTEKFTFFQHDDGNKDSIGVGAVRALHEASSGELWVGLSGGGLNRFDRDDINASVEKFSTQDGLINAFVEGILEDDNGNLWISTAQGLSELNVTTGQFRNLTKDHGLAGNLYNYPAHLKTLSGELVFGSSEGLTIFNPAEIYKNTRPPPIVMTDFKLFHERVDIRAKDSPLAESITVSKSLTLRHDQSVFSIEFAALNYAFPHMNQYAYILEGFDQDWVYSGENRSATYTNLDPGSYIFKVKGSNNEGVWSIRNAQLQIRILPPWWRTWWSYGVYTLLLGLSIIWVIKFQINRLDLKNRIRLDQIKDTFLSCTSHELRTPLTGIISLTEMVLARNRSELPPSSCEHLEIVVKSAQRLSLLINDILDYSQIKNNQLKLHCEHINLYDVIESVLTLLSPIALQKRIQLINTFGDTSLEVYADRDRLQQILLNLVNNGIKYSDAGWVKIRAQQSGSSLKVEVEDTGYGIPESEQRGIFESFHQLPGTSVRNAGGIGLGLPITKKIIEMHGGQVYLISAVGKGSTFTFTLPQPF